MLSYTNSYDTVIVVLHEIYGIDNHIKNVCEEFSWTGYDVVCPDLLGLGKPFCYAREQEAYRYFMNNIGFDSASQIVTHLVSQLRNKYKRVILAGYSIGATIGWLCSENTDVDGFVGFYGSRIRDYLNIAPRNRVLLLFPYEENSFSSEQIANKLLEKKNVEVHVFEGRHGFADPFSKNYNESSSNEAKKIVRDFLNRINPGDS